jgi:hypothetical protein
LIGRQLRQIELPIDRLNRVDINRVARRAGVGLIGRPLGRGRVLVGVGLGDGSAIADQCRAQLASREFSFAVDLKQRHPVYFCLNPRPLREYEPSLEVALRWKDAWPLSPRSFFVNSPANFFSPLPSTRKLGGPSSRLGVAAKTAFSPPSPFN